MSRGHGRVQQAVLRQLGQRPAHAYDLARAAFGLDSTQEPTQAQVESVRRAVRTLRRAGLVGPLPRTPRGYSTRAAVRSRRNRATETAALGRLNVELFALLEQEQG
jgi:hypothetical protein